MLHINNCPGKGDFFNNGDGPFLELAPQEYWDVCVEDRRYEILYTYGGEELKCFVRAASPDEALGNFFRHHQNVTYDDIIEHMEY